MKIHDNGDEMNTIDTNDVLKKREKKFWSGAVFYVILLALIIFGVYIRTLPMVDHGGGKPGLWDITKNTWTLGPDLDPFLFLRYARLIESNGSIPELDMMRYVPLGYDTTEETTLLPRMIVWTHKALEAIGTPDSPNSSLEYAAIIFPVIMFALTIISFFLFIRLVFIRKEGGFKNTVKANIIALASTFFMIIMPSFLSRTIAGIPEKESPGFFFLFLALYLFLKAWKSEGKIKPIIYGLLSGVATALMGLVWGGFVYIYTTIAISVFLAIILNKMEERYADAYICWFLASFVMLLTLTNRFNITGFITSLYTSIALFVLVILLVYWSLKTIYTKFGLTYPNKIPMNILAILLSIIIGILGLVALFGFHQIFDMVGDISRIMFNPAAGGRWVTTVAENMQPYFTQWFGNFGTYAFTLILIGAVWLFMDTLKIKKKDLTILSGLFIYFLFGLIFSRYEASSVFNGTNFISKFLFISSIVALIGGIVYYFWKYHKEKDYSFEKTDFEYLFLLVLFIIALFTARSAIRLVMTITIIAPVMIMYFIWSLYEQYEKIKEGASRFLMISLIIFIVFLAGYSALTYYNVTKGQAYSTVPYYYTLQWQQAMDWVRDYTAPTAVFAHWWDYGYWVQSIGERATVTDGGNSNIWWNYLTGRLVLTGDNQKDSLDYLYAHNVSYLLIDSSDMGKYGAFSQIGSDAEMDRLSYGPVTMTSNIKNIVETKNETIRQYQGQGYVEEDITYDLNGKQIYLPTGASYLIGALTSKSSAGTWNQAKAIYYYNGVQTPLPIRYLYARDKNDTLQFIDFGTGIDATLYLIDNMDTGQLDREGAALFISPRLMRGFLSQVYILNDPFNNFPAFKLAYQQPDYILQYYLSQGLKINEFTYAQGLKGPIKIWNINYTGNETINPEYLLRTPPEYITWNF